MTSSKCRAWAGGGVPDRCRLDSHRSRRFSRYRPSLTVTFRSPPGTSTATGSKTLSLADGIHLGVGDGTFESTVVDGPLGELRVECDGHRPRVILARTAFRISPSPRSAPTGAPASYACFGMRAEINSIPSTRSSSIPTPSPSRRSTWAMGSWTWLSPTIRPVHVAIFVGDGNGGFATGPVLYGGSYPVAMAAGQFGDGHR